MSYLPREKRRQTIIAAAAQIIATNGLLEVNARSVSTTLGGSQGQINHHFSSIEELKAEAWLEYSHSEMKAFHAATHASTSEEQLSLFFSDLVEGNQKGHSLARWAEASAYARVQPEFAPSFMATVDELLDILAECLARNGGRQRATRLLMTAFGLAGLPQVSSHINQFSISEVMRDSITAALLESTNNQQSSNTGTQADRERGAKNGTIE